MRDHRPRLRSVARDLFARHGYAPSRCARSPPGGCRRGRFIFTPRQQTLLYNLMRGHMDELLAALAAEPMRRTRARALPPSPLPRPLPPRPPGRSFHCLHGVAQPDAANSPGRAPAPRLRGRAGAILRDGVAVGAFRVPDAKLATRALIAMLTGSRNGSATAALARAEVEAIYAEMALRAWGR